MMKSLATLILLAGCSQAYYYRDDYRSREGTYRIYGFLQGYSSDPYYYGRENYGGGSRCPYDNPDERGRSRYKRSTEVNTEVDLAKTEAENITSASPLSALSARGVVKAIAKRATDREQPVTSSTVKTHDSNNEVSALFNDDSRYVDNYPYGRYPYSRYPDYYNRYPDNYYHRPSYRENCRDNCMWEAELTCDISRLGRDSYYWRDRGYVRWERENDSYYPRNKYRDVLDYFGTRAVIDDSTDGLSTLIIRKVKPEDKGVYRCYLEGGNERDFMEVHFYPRYPDRRSYC